jgi:hypothetical protein
MHRSRLSSVVIDCGEAGPLLTRNERFSSLRGRIGGEGALYVGLQQVPIRERAIHLDIETDDVEAEVARLERLGARVKARIRRHVVMESPSGHAFCVVPVQRGDFPVGAVEWP